MQIKDKLSTHCTYRNIQEWRKSEMLGGFLSLNVIELFHLQNDIRTFLCKNVKKMCS